VPGSAALDRLAPDLWRWVGPHPEWKAGDFGAVVGSYAVVSSRSLLLIDPLVPTGAGSDVLAAIDELASGRDVHVLITIGYHVRSAALLSTRFDAPVWGPKTLRARLDPSIPLRILEPGDHGPAGVVAQAVGKPRRSERPLWIPSHRALVFGDAVVTTPVGELRLWSARPVDDHVREHFARRVGPSLEPLIDLDPARILVTHGDPVLDHGADALRRAAAAGVWYHAG
jgi:glyoxylase-like metal-dependent hydrolase (beta-lactamase superfamily II)